VRIAAVALLVLAVATGCGTMEEQTSPQPQTTTTTEAAASDSARDAAPQLSGTSLDGDPIALVDFRGRPLLINVWSSW
jgi:uncharacterized protein YceK